jgi:hypothetical protein
MKAIVELFIKEHDLTVTKVVDLAFNKDDKLKEQYLLFHAHSPLKI